LRKKKFCIHKYKKKKKKKKKKKIRSLKLLNIVIIISSFCFFNYFFKKIFSSKFLKYIILKIEIVHKKLEKKKMNTANSDLEINYLHKGETDYVSYNR